MIWKNNTVLPIAALLTVSLLLGSCSAKEASTTEVPVSSSVTAVTPKEGDYTVTGKVTKVIGNQITLALGTVSSESGQGESIPSSSTEDEQAPQLPEGMGEMPDGASLDGKQGFEGGASGEQGFGQRNGVPTGQPSPRTSASLDLTGESSDYLIPVGLTLSGTARGGDFESVSVGETLTLTLRPGSGETDRVVSVEVL